MRFGMSLTFGASLQEAVLDQCEADYLEVGVKSFLVPERPEHEFVALWQQAQRLPIPVEVANGLLPADLVLVSTPMQPVDDLRLERYIKTTLQRAQQVGIRLLVFGSGSARSCPPGYDHADALRQISERVAQWAVWAGQHQIQLVVEPLCYAETNVLNTLAESGAWLSHIEHSGVRLLADFYHMRANQETPESLSSYVSLLSHVHVAELEGRAAPGRHGEDLRPYLRALRKRGYDRRISIECHWHHFAAEVGPALAELRQQWADCLRTGHI